MSTGNYHQNMLNICRSIVADKTACPGIIRKDFAGVILAAGMGTRTFPFGITGKKGLSPAYNVQAVLIQVLQMVRAGIGKIIFVIDSDDHPLVALFQGNEKLTSQLDSAGKSEHAELVDLIPRLAEFVFVIQKKPLGDGDAVLVAINECTKNELISNETVLVVRYIDDMAEPANPSSDSNVILEMIQTWDNGEQNFTVLLAPVDPSEAHLFGIANIEEKEGIIRITKLVEKPKYEIKNPYSNAGIYIGRALEFTCNLLGFEADSKNELKIVQAVQNMLDSNVPVNAHLHFGMRFNFGDIDGQFAAQLYYKTRFLLGKQ